VCRRPREGVLHWIHVGVYCELPCFIQVPEVLLTLLDSIATSPLGMSNVEASPSRTGARERAPALSAGTVPRPPSNVASRFCLSERPEPNVREREKPPSSTNFDYANLLD